MERTGGQSPPEKLPPSPDFHGFGPDTDLPSKLVIYTAGVEDEEYVVRVTRKREKGRPRTGNIMLLEEIDVNPSNIIGKSRRESGSQQP